MNIPKLTLEGCYNRRSCLIQDLDLDLVVIANPRNLYYFAGFLPPFPSLSEWGPVFLVIDVRNGDSTLICHNFAADAARNSYTDQKEIWTWYNASEDCGIEMYVEGAEILRDFIHSKSHSAKIGIETGFFPMIHDLASTLFTDITPLISNMQRRKYPDELTCIRYAQDSALAGHEAARKEIQPGMTELDLFSLINAAMIKKAGMPVKLIGDIISGPRVLEVSGGPTSRIIEQSDTIILDLSPVVGGYRADYTATIVLDPQPNKKTYALEKTLHEAIESGKKMLFPGKKGREVYAAVKSCLEDRGFGGGFSHHAGHGMGLGHPEAPYFVMRSEEELVIGDVVTLEPGSYDTGCAGRIEHVFLITADGPEQLSRHDTRFRL